MSRTIICRLGELVNAEPALQRVLSVSMDAKTRYHAVKLARLVAAETKHFVDEREAAIRALGVERPATPDEIDRGQLGPVIAVPLERQTEFFQRMTNLAAVSVTVPWGPLTTAMLDGYSAVTGRDCIELGPLYELDPNDPAQNEASSSAPEKGRPA